MQALEQKILKEGQVLPGNILKVGSFLNQKIDIDFLFEMGKEIARLFDSVGVTKILTIETSGLPIAVAAAKYLKVPVVFAKKHKSSNVDGEVYTASIHSFTHGNTYTAMISKDYIGKEDKILIVDDFLAVGNALKGLIEITEKSGAELKGCAIAIEKGFQKGGDLLREKGIKVESLAIVESMTDSSLTFRK